MSQFFVPLLVVIPLFSGCGSTGSVYRDHRDVVPGGAQIVVFRPDTFFQGGIPYLVRINGKEAAVLRNGGFSVVGVAPGMSVVDLSAANSIQALSRTPSLSVVAMANERVFVRATPELGNRAALQVVSAAAATPELHLLKESQ